MQGWLRIQELTTVRRITTGNQQSMKYLILSIIILPYLIAPFCKHAEYNKQEEVYRYHPDLLAEDMAIEVNMPDTVKYH